MQDIKALENALDSAIAQIVQLRNEQRFGEAADVESYVDGLVVRLDIARGYRS